MKTSVVSLFLLLGMAPLQAQFNPPDVLDVEAFLSVDTVRPGDEFKIGIKASLRGDWHVNAHQPSEEYLIPTIVSFDSVTQVTWTAPTYPTAQLKKFEFADEPMAVYDGEFVIWAAGIVGAGAPLGDMRLSGKLSYQACNDVSCLAPTSVPFEIRTTLAAANTPVTSINAHQFASTSDELDQLQGEREDNEINQLMTGRGVLLTFGLIFLGGLALNLTPCVYPIIPITISFFVGQGAGKISRSFFLALIYVLGLSVTYSLLGVVAAMTGGLLGATLQNPIVLVAIAAVFMAFAASMFGAFEIRVPNFLNRLAGGSRQGAWGSLLMGLTVGIVAAPCIGPFVLSLLTYVAARGDALTGFLMFFVLSLGLGLPFLVLGTFSGSIRSLPRSGEWMVWVKKVFGVIMVAMAVYFINPLLPETFFVVLLTLSVVLGGVFIGFVDKSKASFALFKTLKTGTGIALIAAGIWISYTSYAEANAPRMDWKMYDQALIAEATSAGRPVLIDFYADWCIPCKQIDRGLFAQKRLIERSASFLVLKADLTKENSDEVQALRRRYRVYGVPTIILLDKYGNEYNRFTDELLTVDPLDFEKIMQEGME